MNSFEYLYGFSVVAVKVLSDNCPRFVALELGWSEMEEIDSSLNPGCSGGWLSAMKD